MKLLIEPEDGIQPILSAIEKAKRTIDIAVFRFDRKDVEKALKDAAARGVKVTALVACTNRGGQESLRKLEMRWLAAGITVARTADDLVRYHGKYMIIDGHVLCLDSFNFTHLDVDRSRAFGIITSDSLWVNEAAKLFEADRTRDFYVPGSPTFVVSPANARKTLSNFLKRARKQLLIYDPEISDEQMIRVLNERRKAGVEVRVIGEVSNANIAAAKLKNRRLHTRTILRDGRQAFIGSQSLRGAELDARREVGLIVREPKTVRRLVEKFESDWQSADKNAPQHAAERGEAKIDPDKVERVLLEELHPVTKTVKRAVKKVVERAGEEVLEDEIVKDTVKKVVKGAIKQAVKSAENATNS